MSILEMAKEKADKVKQEAAEEASRAAIRSEVLREQQTKMQECIDDAFNELTESKKLGFTRDGDILYHDKRLLMRAKVEYEPFEFRYSDDSDIVKGYDYGINVYYDLWKVGLRTDEDGFREELAKKVAALL